MRILDWNTLDEGERAAALARPHLTTAQEVTHAARDAIAAVRASGDAAVRALTEQFDHVALHALQVSRAELAAAQAQLAPAQHRALERAIANVRSFHAAQLPAPVAIETEPGVLCEQLVRPLGAVGLYAPAGSAPLPSTVIMLAVPAQVAGCRQRILCTPPRADGHAHPAVLAAASLCGIEQVFKVGGAQAIAAMAYGTASIPRVDKIFGPGNAWVTAAKQLVSGDPAGAACDLPAGPSEVMVIADRSARAAFIAADLLAQAEHDPLAQALLVTDSTALAAAVGAAVAEGVAGLSRGAVLAHSLRSCRCLVVPDLESAFRIANAYAPEHLLVQVAEPRRWLAHVHTAGSVFLGEWSPETLGDYCTGTNHVLPTYGYARAYSGLSVRDFVRTMSVQQLSAEALRALGPTAVTLAGLEGLDAHALAVNRRLEALAQVPA
jgi:histidinol dehydrogenase